MPGTYRYSASLDKTYKDDENGPVKFGSELDNQNGSHNRTCSMDSLDSISSSGGSLAGSSCSGGTHSRQLSNDSTSSPTNLSTSYLNSRMPPSSSVKPIMNPHQFIKAGPSTLFRSATEQIKVVKENVKTFRSPVKEDEEEWQNNLSSWKSKRRTMSEKTFQRVDEMKKLETVDDESPKKKNKTFSQMRQDKARRNSSYNLSVSTEFTTNSEKIVSEEIVCEENKSESIKDDDNKEDMNGIELYENVNKDKDDGYSSKDECNKTEADDQSDIMVPDDQMSTVTESSGVSDHEVPFVYLNSSDLESKPTNMTESNEEVIATEDDNVDNENSKECLNSNLESKTHEIESSNDQLNNFSHDEPSQLKMDDSLSTDSLLLKIKPNAEIKDFGFTMKGGKEFGSAVIVDSVVPDGAAYKAGLFIGNLILSINGEATLNRSHSSLVFAVKQAVYTGQLLLEVCKTLPEDYDAVAQTCKKATSEKVFNNTRSIFLNKSNETEHVDRPIPSRESVSKRRSMFDNLANQESPKSRPSVDVKVSLKDRVASFDCLQDSTLKDEEKKLPPTVKPKPKIFEKREILPPSPDILCKESILSQPDLIETSIDSMSDEDDKAPAENDYHFEDKAGADESSLIDIDVVKCDNQQKIDNIDMNADSQDECVREIIELPDQSLDQICNKLFMDEDRQNLVETLPTTPEPIAVHEGVKTENSAPTSTEDVNDEGCVEDVSDALDEALAIFDDFEPIQSQSSNDDSSSISKNQKNDLQKSLMLTENEEDRDLNIIFDSCPPTQSCDTLDLFDNQAYVIDDSFDRPRSIAEPPKEKPPPPPVEAESQQSPPMKRINSTKRIKKEIWRRRSDFLGLGDSKEEADYEEMIPKPRRQMEDLLRFELEHEKSLPSPTLSSEYSLSSQDLTTGVPSEFHSEYAEKNMAIYDDPSFDEEEHIRKIEEQRIQRQEIRKRAEEEKLLHERVEQMRKQQEMLILEKDRLKREQDEVLKAKRNSLSGEIQRQDCKENKVIPNYIVNKNRPRAPPPPPPKPTLSTCKFSRCEQGERDRNEVIRLSRRPTSGDYSNFDMFPSDPHSQPIQKQPLSRHSLQSLSAVPKASRLNSDSHWMKRDEKTKRKVDAPRKDAYSHWLIQEAEFRRISEHSERQRSDKNSNMNRYNSMYSKSESNLAFNGENNLYDCVADSRNYDVDDTKLNSKSKEMGQSSSHEWSQNFDKKVVKSRSIDIMNSEMTIDQEHYMCDEPHNTHRGNHYDYVASSTTHHQNQYNYMDFPLPDHNGKYPKDFNGIDYFLNSASDKTQDNMLSVSGRKKCSSCNEELGRGAAMIIESLKLFYHIKCFRCSVCQVQLGNGSCGADVRVRNHKLHCQNCYSNDEAGLKFSKV